MTLIVGRLGYMAELVGEFGYFKKTVVKQIKLARVVGREEWRMVSLC